MTESSTKQMNEALLRLFVDLGAGDGSPLLLDQLRLEWTKMQLHSPDLIDGLRGLVFDGWLELQHTDAGPTMRLSQRARQRAGSAGPGFAGLLRQAAVAAFAAKARPAETAVAAG